MYIDCGAVFITMTAGLIPRLFCRRRNSLGMRLCNWRGGKEARTYHVPCKTQLLFLDHPTKATDITLCILVERSLILMPYLAM